jgi:hypothetical protein
MARGRLREFNKSTRKSTSDAWHCHIPRLLVYKLIVAEMDILQHSSLVTLVILVISFTTVIVVAQTCTVCPGGDKSELSWTQEIPNPGRNNITSTQTCYDLVTNPTAYQQSFLFVGQAEEEDYCSDSILRRSAAWCFCEGAAIECSLCDGELTSSQLESIVHPLSGTSCQYYAYQTSLLSADECPLTATFLSLDVSALCCGTPPPNICSICGVGDDGTTIPLLDEKASNNISTTNSAAYGDSISCSQAQQTASFLPNREVCEKFLEDLGGATAVASSCCQDTTTTTTTTTTTLPNCELICYNTGLPPVQMDRMDPVTGYNCQSLSETWSQFSPEECPTAAQIIGFDAVSYCCDSIPPPQTCSICHNEEDEQEDEDASVLAQRQQQQLLLLQQQGQQQGEDAVERMLLYPEQILFQYKGYSCGMVETAASFLVGESVCQAFMDETRASQICKCRRTKKLAPVNPPPLDNGVGSDVLNENDSLLRPSRAGTRVVPTATTATTTMFAYIPWHVPCLLFYYYISF